MRNSKLKSENTNLKDIIFIASVVLFSSLLITKGIVFANPVVCTPDGKCEGGMVIQEDPWLLRTFIDNPLLFAIVFNLIFDTVVFWIFALILKVKRSINTYFVPIPFILVIGFISDYIGLLIDEGPIGFILVSLMIFAGDYLVLRYISKLENKKVLLISLGLAVLTNPFLWLILNVIKSGGLVD